MKRVLKFIDNEIIDIKNLDNKNKDAKESLHILKQKKNEIRKKNKNELKKNKNELKKQNQRNIIKFEKQQYKLDNLFDVNKNLKNQ